MSQQRLNFGRPEKKSLVKAKEEYDVANLEAAKIIVAAGDKYKGGLLQWAVRILEKDSSKGGSHLSLPREE